MNWVSENWKWLAAIVVPIVAAIVGYFIKRSWEPKPQPSSQLTAQGARVSKSPVASGSNIKQTLTTHHHHYGEKAISAPPPTTPQSEKPPKKLVTGLPRTLSISVKEDGTFYASASGKSEAVLIQFTNEPDAMGKNLEVTAKARIVFCDDNDVELGRVNDGCWLEERVNVKDFGFDETHELVIAAFVDGELLAFTNVRNQEHYHSEDDEGVKLIPIQGFRSGTVDVRLTNKYTGMVLNHSRFRLTAEPLKAIRLESA
jgi:hypothetical protein